MIIGNYTYEQYLRLTDDERDEYTMQIMYAKNLEKADYLGHKAVDEWTFTDVKECMECIENGDADGFVKYITDNLKGYEEKRILKERAYRVLLTFAYLTQKVGEMIETERMTLVSHIETETRIALEQVDFSMFSYYPQLLELANNDITKIEEVSKMPYCDAYMYLYYNAKKSELEKAITNIYKNKKR